jgi:hypothetical protein
MTHTLATIPLAAVCLCLLAPAAYSAAGQEAKQPPSRIKPVRIEPGDTPLQKLRKARFNVAVAEAGAFLQSLQSGHLTVQQMLSNDSAPKLMQASLALDVPPAAKKALLEQCLGLLKDEEKVVQARVNAGALSSEWLHHKRYLRLNAEIELARLNGRQPPRALLKARYDEAAAAVNDYEQKNIIGVLAAHDLPLFLQSIRQVIRATVELDEPIPARVGLLEKQLASLTKFEHMREAEHKIGKSGTAGVCQARYWRLDAQIKLLRLQGKPVPADLVQEKLRQVLQELKEYDAKIAAGVLQSEEWTSMVDAARRLADVALEQNAMPQAKEALVQKALDHVKQMEATVRAGVQVAKYSASELHALQFHRLGLEIRLHELKDKGGKGPQ